VLLPKFAVLAAAIMGSKAISPETVLFAYIVRTPHPRRQSVSGKHIRFWAQTLYRNCDICWDFMDGSLRTNDPTKFDSVGLTYLWKKRVRHYQVRIWSSVGFRNERQWLIQYIMYEVLIYWIILSIMCKKMLI